MCAEEPNSRESPGAFQAIEVVVFPLLAGPEILTDLEVAGQPIDPGLEVAVGSSFAAILDHLALEEFQPLEPMAPAMIKLETPAQVMLAEDAGESGVYAQLPSFFWHRSQYARASAQTSGLTGTPASLAACRPSRAYWVLELSPCLVRLVLV